MPDLSDEERLVVAYSLRHARGRYGSERASQLSGIPQRTIYDWRREKVFLTDYPLERPATWSYRDLVLLRLLAWLRQGGMPRPRAAEKVASVRSQLSEGRDIRQIHATRAEIILSGDPGTRFDDDKESLLPFSNFYELLSTFDLHEPIRELRSVSRKDVWAPNLIAPSQHSRISPWVQAGDPCVADSRIPTAAIYALRTERNLPVGSVVELYPGLREPVVEDVTRLERRLRGVDEPLAA
ncbi:MAG: hypothetical protein OXC06_02925 [Acidimicrobiaceae bacterium]|nr:hypothetical protein [Acidimicrobiaceae bacterium]